MVHLFKHTFAFRKKLPFHNNLSKCLHSATTTLYSFKFTFSLDSLWKHTLRLCNSINNGIM